MYKHVSSSDIKTASRQTYWQKIFHYGSPFLYR